MIKKSKILLKVSTLPKSKQNIKSWPREMKMDNTKFQELKTSFKLQVIQSAIQLDALNTFTQSQVMELTGQRTMLYQTLVPIEDKSLQLLIV